jgi:hypothetical protein
VGDSATAPIDEVTSERRRHTRHVVAPADDQNKVFQHSRASVCGKIQRALVDPHESRGRRCTGGRTWSSCMHALRDTRSPVWRPPSHW